MPARQDQLLPDCQRLNVLGVHSDGGMADWLTRVFGFEDAKGAMQYMESGAHFGKVTMGGGDAFLQIPTQTSTSGAAQLGRFNQFRAALGYGSASKRGFSAASSFGYDAEVSKLQYVSTQTTYNWDCCGATLEYRSYTIANVRNENLFRFTFTLANIGGFGSLRHQESLY